MPADDIQRLGHQAPVLRLGDKLTTLAPGASTTPDRCLVDVCFVFDTTGSMEDKIDGLVDCLGTLVVDLARLALDWRVTTVPFGDFTVPGDRIVADQPFVADLRSASAQLRSMPRFDGGGNNGESSVEAMLAACEKRYRQGAVKVLVLITDEPALGHRKGAPAVASALSALDAACFTVAPPLKYYRCWAECHGGQWRQVSHAVDTSALMRLFGSLLARIAQVADCVHRIGHGSVRTYLSLGSGDAAP